MESDLTGYWYDDQKHTGDDDNVYSYDFQNSVNFICSNGTGELTNATPFTQKKEVYFQHQQPQFSKPVTEDVSCQTEATACLGEDSLDCIKESNARIQELEKELEKAKSDLSNTQNTVEQLRQREKKLMDRLSDQVQKRLQQGATKFEDLSLGENRPSQLIKRYGNLYSDGRLDAMDALDDIPDLLDCEELKDKLLFSVMILAFRSATTKLLHIKTQLRTTLGIPNAPDILRDPVVRELEQSIEVYLRKSVARYDMSECINEVCNQVWETLYDYPCLKTCDSLLKYIDEAVRLAWALSVQVPPFTIEYEMIKYDEDRHLRFYTSDQDSLDIKAVLWPVLVEDEGQCAHKGIVLT